MTCINHTYAQGASQVGVTHAKIECKFCIKKKKKKKNSLFFFGFLFIGLKMKRISESQLKANIYS